jgi:hypothetical protein
MTSRYTHIEAEAHRAAAEAVARLVEGRAHDPAACACAHSGHPAGVRRC